MTPTTPIGAGSLPIQATDPNMGSLASQNMFEHIARTSSTSSQGITPAGLGSDVISNLDGFIERVQSFSSRTNSLESPSLTMTSGLEQAQIASDGANADAAGGPGESDFDRMIESLSRVFDHSIETQMVVRGTTQISGSANTLLRGQ